MTSDSENKFKYSAQRANRTTSKFSIATVTAPTRSASAIPPAALAQQRERERLSSSSSSSTSTTSTSTMITPTRAPGRCLPHELRCVSGKCITVNQLCDKVKNPPTQLNLTQPQNIFLFMQQVDCPDAADEIMCVYRERPSTRVVTTAKPTMRTKTTTTPNPTLPTTTINPTTATPTASNTTRRAMRNSPNRSRKPKS